jgi:hypothetical protein
VCIYQLHNRQCPSEDSICMYGVGTQTSASFLYDPRESRPVGVNYTTPPDTTHDMTRCTWTSLRITQEQDRCLCANSVQNVNKYGLTLGTDHHYIILTSQYRKYYTYQFFLHSLELHHFKRFNTGSVIPRVTCCGLYSFFYTGLPKNGSLVPKHVGVLILVRNCPL